jgi:hypothetical protein
MGSEVPTNRYPVGMVTASVGVTTSMIVSDAPVNPAASVAVTRT